jgi:transposase-like protein
MSKSTKRTKRHGKYDPVLKREIGRRYLASEFSYQAAAEEYGLPGRDTVKEFVRWYRRELAVADQHTASTDQEPAIQPPVVEGQNLAEEVAELRRQLRQSEQRAEAWKAMIDTASAELEIDIVKKRVPKPSRD